MKTKRGQEGYLLVDHRACGGVTLERATITCSHCQRLVILNPDRARARGYCPGCDHYLCDVCEAARSVTGCRPFNEFADRIQEAAVRSLNHL